MDADVDTAALTVVSTNNSRNLFLQTLSSECFECAYFNETHGIAPERNHTFIIDTKYGTDVRLIWDNKEILSCFGIKHFDANGKYQVNVSDDGTKCPIFTLENPERHPYLCILWAFIFYCGLYFLWFFGKMLYKYNCFRTSNEQLLISDLGSPDDPTGIYHLPSNFESQSTTPARKRLVSLDTFRGICIVIMIFVELGGGKFWFFEHARWNGLTFADLVFPWFMWIMGTSAALSVHSLLRQAVPKRKIFIKILKRSVILFALGLMINTKDGWDLDTMRVMGVLQRFGITYFIVVSVELLFSCANDALQVPVSRFNVIRDLRLSWCQWLVFLGFVTVHTCLTFLLPVPECPSGYLGPGGVQDDENFQNCTGGAAGFIDRMILGEEHMYQKPTFRQIYHTHMPYDPEGLLGILTASFMVFLGLQAGKILIAYMDHKARLYRWLGWGVITGSLGTLLCLGTKNTGWIPINKNLWSISFVLVLSGLAFLLLAFCYFIMEVKSKWSGAPFYYSGMNSIAVYIGLEFTKGVFPFGWLGCRSHDCYLALALWGTSLWVIVAFLLHRSKVFISI